MTGEVKDSTATSDSFVHTSREGNREFRTVSAVS